MSIRRLENIKYEEKEVKILLAVLAVFFLFSLFVWTLTVKGKRYTFRFESTDSGRVSVEYRYLPKKSYPENVFQYVDELVIGPKTERFNRLFSYGTHIISSFVTDDDVLFVNLSSDVLEMVGNCSDIKTGIKLFKKNVLKTFGKIKTVEMYIDNKSIYTQDDENVKK